MRRKDSRYNEEDLRKAWWGGGGGKVPELSIGEVLSAEEREKGLSQHYRTALF